MRLVLLLLAVSFLQRLTHGFYEYHHLVPNHTIQVGDRMRCFFNEWLDQDAMTCLLETLPSLQLIMGMTCHVQDIVSSPIMFHRYLDGFLCLRSEYCWWSQKLPVETMIFQLFQQSFPSTIFQQDPFIDLFVYLGLYLEIALPHYQLSFERASDISLKDLQITKLFTVVLIFPTFQIGVSHSDLIILNTNNEESDVTSDQQPQRIILKKEKLYQLREYFLNLRQEIIEMSKIFHLIVFYSVEYIFLEKEIENSMIKDLIIQQFHEFDLMVRQEDYQSLVPMTGRLYVLPSSSSSSTNLDYRYYHIQSIRKEIKVDIFILPVWQLIGLRTYSILNIVNNLLFGGYTSKFGMVSTSIFPLGHESDEIFSFPAFHFSHLQFFENIEFMRPTFSTELNNLLLEDVYSGLFSLRAIIKVYNTSKLTLPSQFLTINDEERNEDYLDQFSLLRRRLFESFYLNQSLDESFFYTAFDLTKRQNDVYSNRICDVEDGCLQDELTHPSLIIERIPRSIVLLERIRDIIHVKGYNSRLAAQKKIYFHRKSDRSIYLNSLYWDDFAEYSVPRAGRTSRSWTASDYVNPWKQRNPHKATVAVITGIFGGYEKSCRSYYKQTIATDFYCFTDDEEITGQGWMIDTIPYYLFELIQEFHQNELDEVNAFHSNQHPFNLAKFYKQQFHKIPILSNYSIIIWIDGSLHIRNSLLSKMIVTIFSNNPERIILFEHGRNGLLKNEYNISFQIKYTNLTWLGISQPFQQIHKQYEEYSKPGNYEDQYWVDVKEQRNWLNRTQYGVFCTCFIAFKMKEEDDGEQEDKEQGGEGSNVMSKFLSNWGRENRHFSTQDQISFPYVAQKWKLNPYPLPNDDIYGNSVANNIFHKDDHGK